MDKRGYDGDGAIALHTKDEINSSLERRKDEPTGKNGGANSHPDILIFQKERQRNVIEEQILNQK